MTGPPMLGLMVSVVIKRLPDAPASAAARPKVTSRTRSTSIPQIWAISADWAVARTALPYVVRCKKNHTASVITTAAVKAIERDRESAIPPSSKAPRKADTDR